GEGDQVVGGRGRGREIAVVPDEIPASGGGEAARVRLAEVVRVRLGERRQGADDGGRIAVDVGQCGDRLSGTAVPGAAPWGPHGGTLSPRGLAWGAMPPRHADPWRITIRPTRQPVGTNLFGTR